MTRGGVWRVARYFAGLVVAGAALGYVVIYLRIAISRMAFPFALEWMEGGSLVQVSRLLSGELIYVRPSFEFVPQIYPPLYFYVSALTSKIIGGGFLPLRLTSFVASIGILLLLAGLVRQQSGSLLGGLAAAGFFAATYPLSGYWFDVGRVDSTALALALLAAYLLLRGNAIASAIGGMCLALSILTKQTMLLAALAMAAYCLLPPCRRSLLFLGTGVAVLAGVTLGFTLAHDGWFTYYVFDLPSRHSLIPGAATKALGEILLGSIVRPASLAVFIGLAYLVVFPGSCAPLDRQIHWEAGFVVGPWPSRSVRLVVWGAVALAAASIVFLGALPSNPEGRVLGPYSAARLGLIGGQVLFGLLGIGAGVLLARNPTWSDRLAVQLYRDVRTVPRLVLACVLGAALSVLALTEFGPQALERVTGAYLERLFPYLAEPVLLLAGICVSWRLIWGEIRQKTWFFWLLAGSLVVTSWIGRLNQGGYLNAFMPAYAAIALLLGLGIGEGSRNSGDRPSVQTAMKAVVVPSMAAVQLFSMFYAPVHQIPTQSDVQAGLEFVSRIRACPGDVYVPFHTYLAELAGKKGYAGWIEMAELRGQFGGEEDRLWKEVRDEIRQALESRSLAAIVQDNVPFGDVVSPQYRLVGRVFSASNVFWPVTGWRVRPESIYMPTDSETCDLTVE